MNKTINHFLIMFLVIIIFGCSTNDANNIDLEINNPHKVVNIKPDYCKEYGWED